MHSIELDHIVMACRDLDSGSAWVEQQLGVAPAGGGQHLGWGTHNRLLSLQAPDFPGVYLELIALDPTQEQRTTMSGSLFSLQQTSIQDFIRQRPRIIHAVFRVAPGLLTQTVAQPSYPIDAPQTMRRGHRQWQIALAKWPDRPRQLTQPSLIDWGEDPGAGFGLPPSGVTLKTWRAEALQAEVHCSLGLRVLD